VRVNVGQAILDGVLHVGVEPASRETRVDLRHAQEGHVRHRHGGASAAFLWAAERPAQIFQHGKERPLLSGLCGVVGSPRLGVGDLHFLGHDGAVRIRGAAVGTPDPLDACENASAERYNRTELLVGVFDPGRLEANLSYLPRGAVRDLRPPATRASQESAPVQHVFTEGPPLGNRVFRIVHATPPTASGGYWAFWCSIAIFGAGKGLWCKAKAAGLAPQPSRRPKPPLSREVPRDGEPGSATRPGQGSTGTGRAPGPASARRWAPRPGSGGHWLAGGSWPE